MKLKLFIEKTRTTKAQIRIFDSNTKSPKILQVNHCCDIDLLICKKTLKE